MSWSSAAASQAQRGRSSVCGGKGVLLAGKLVVEVPSQQGEGGLPVRMLGFGTEAWLMEELGWQCASAVKGRCRLINGVAFLDLSQIPE